MLKGEVRKVEKEAREVTMRHEAIPGFMEAMTMPFHLEDQAPLEDLQAGRPGRGETAGRVGERPDQRLPAS